MPWESRTNNPAQSDYFGVICRYFSCCFLLKVNSVYVYGFWSEEAAFLAEQWVPLCMRQSRGRMGVYTQLGEEVSDAFTNTRSSLWSLSRLAATGSNFFPFPHLHNSILDFSVLPFFIPVFHGHCLSVGNISSGTENITEVTETTLTPTSTLAQQQEMYVFHLHTHVSHMRYIYQAVCGWSIWSCLCADEKF